VGLLLKKILEQRESIFHTWCTMNGNVCSLIIDGGSCATVASKAMMEKLKLAISSHPSPYTIQSLNQGKGFQISSRCFLILSVRKNYKDELWHNIIPMDACHVLLGCPWLFDRRHIHDGRLNTYTFTKYHKKITLTPLKPTPQNKP